MRKHLLGEILSQNRLVKLMIQRSSSSSAGYWDAPGKISPISFSTTKPDSSIWFRTFSAFDAEATLDFEWRNSCSNSLIRYSYEACCANLSIS